MPVMKSETRRSSARRARLRSIRLIAILDVSQVLRRTQPRAGYDIFRAR